MQTRAAAGHTSIRSYSAQFRAVGSTATVDARDNTSTTGTGVPIYWLGGTKVADEYTDFYDGSWDSKVGEARNESGGTAASIATVWTDSNSDGTKDSNFPLGSSASFSRLGNPRIPTAGISNALGAIATSYPLYGLSPVFQVAPQQQANRLSISAPADANEGNSGTRDLTFTVTLGTAISQDVAFDVCFTGTATISTTGTFAAGDDYLARQAGVPQFSNCVTSSAVHGGTTSSNHVSIRVRGDTDFERDETVTATLSFRGTPPAGVTLGTSTVTHTIQNDDADRSATMWITGGPAITEGGNAVFTLHADPAPAAKLAVRLAVIDATESPITDFVRLRDERATEVVIEPGNTTATFAVSTVNDGTCRRLRKNAVIRRTALVN